MRLAHKRGISSKRMVIACLVGLCVIPAYGMVGFGSRTLGIRQGWELFLVAGVYGFLLGPISAFSRSLFASLVPHGREAAFFSLYEITDKGSSWMGPLVLTGVQQATGELRWGFIYILAFLLVPAVALPFLDVRRGMADAEAYVQHSESMRAEGVAGAEPGVIVGVAPGAAVRAAGVASAGEAHPELEMVPMAAEEGGADEGAEGARA
jgi:UMF1 family MFS transporter